MNKRKKYIQKNAISYEKLMDLVDDNCVKVSGTYFYFLIAKGQLLNIRDKKYWETVYKYIQIEKIYHHVKNVSGTPSYILMSVEDIKYLVNYVMDGLNPNHVFIKSEVKATELNKSIKLIKKQYVEKQEQNKNGNKMLLKNNFVDLPQYK